jgi:hypothetical protein
MKPLALCICWRQAFSQRSLTGGLHTEGFKGGTPQYKSKKKGKTTQKRMVLNTKTTPSSVFIMPKV